MAKKVEVEIEVKSKSVEGSIAQLKELKAQLKKTAAGTPEFKELYNQIDDLEDKIKGTKKASSDWIDSLEGAGGPIGALGKGLNALKVSTVSFGAALKATGIGLIVGLIGSLTAAFAESDEEMQKFNPIIIQLQKILNGVLGAVQPLIDGFIELAGNVLPYVSEAFRVVYSAVTAVFQSLGKLGSAVVKLLKGDFAGAWEDAKGAVTGFADNYEKASDRFVAGTEKRTKKEKELLKDGEDARKKALEERLKRMEVEDKIDEANLAKLKAEALALAKTEQEKLDVEKTFAEKSYQLKKQELEDKQKLYNKNSNEYKELTAQLIQLDADYTSEKAKFGDEQKKIDEDALKAKKDFEQKARELRDAAIEDELQKDLANRKTKYEKDLADLEADKEFIKKSETEKADLRKALLEAYNNDVDKIEENNKLKKLEEQLKYDEARLKSLQEGTKEYFAQQRVIENDAYEAQKAKAKDNATELEAIEIAHKAVLKNIDQAELEAKRNLQLQIADLYAGFGRSLQQIAGKNKALAIAGLLVEQAAGVATIIINTQKAAAKAGYFTPLGIATLVAGAASVVAAVVATKKGIDQINQTQIPGGASAGGGTSMAQAMPTYTGGGAGSATIPQINASGGANPATQISETIQQSSSKPMRAYVVSGDVTTQQALDRRTNKGATFGLG